ncbi:MAG: 4Fe-4S dicluster domain-containing protein [Dehalococcoidia bacterium]|nr:MAG: 4Fe-4S dicluster domain-containing protein [Dehalococcoidia bacterium]
MEQKLRSEAKSLLEQGKVDYIIGFEPGSLKFTTTPLITNDRGDTSRLVITPFIVNNLSVYLTEVKGRVGIVVKGCDSRSIVSLLQDNKIAREDIVILGIPCHGLIDLSKVEQLVDKDRDEIDDISRDGDRVMVTVGGNKKEFPISETLFDNCLGCELPTPQEYDILLGEPTSPASDEGRVASQEEINRLKDTTPEQRWEFWSNEFDRCIRCYACRNICPACFCERCFVEETEPPWVLPVPRWQDNLVFQVMRNIHVAGRCTDCGECERACPVNIPLRRLSREMYDIVDELFHYKAGMDKDASPFLAAYEATDTGDFIR